MTRPQTKILIIEDDRDLREALTGLLEGAGYRAVAVENGLAAIQHLQHHEAPALILLDLMMPLFDGYQFRREQLRDPSTAAIPILVITGSADDRRLGDMGAVGCLLKPLDAGPVLEAVARHCRGAAPDARTSPSAS
jgi:CheY-like chemotaxis protein